MEKQNKLSDVKEVTQELVGWEDNKLFRTLNYLTTRPGQLITEYCKGEKQKYLSPVIYFFGVTALEAYLVSVSGITDLMLKANAESLRKTLSEREVDKLNINVDNITDQYNSATSFLFTETGQKVIFLPIALILTWLFYKKYNSSFKANSWFALYMLGHVTLLSLPLLLYVYLTKDLVLYTIFGLIMALAYGTWASKQFYNLSLGKALVLRVLMLAAVMLIFGILGPIVMISLMIINAQT